MRADEILKDYLAHPEKLTQKKPFYRGLEYSGAEPVYKDTTYINETVEAIPTSMRVEIVSQDQFMRELDPKSHDVLYDDNIPSITMKTQKGSWVEIKFSRVAVPYQRLIKMKQVLHITGNPLQHTLVNDTPTETENKNFLVFKQYWKKRNMDGMKHKMVDTQKSFGDAGLLFYFDRKKRIKCRLISYKDGYCICSHNDDNGDRLIESIVYVKDDVKYIDSYDDTYFYRHRYYESNSEDNESGWRLEKKAKHGFSEIPLVTKRGDVAWNDVQGIIETYEVIYNVFLVIQKRHGWGILYIKGNYNNKAKKLAGSIILEDTSIDGNGDAKFLTPPSPEGTIDTLNRLEEDMQKGACTTFILPKDIRLSGDVSGIAIQLTQSLDIENAENACIEWKNVANKMTRLFKEGLAKELVREDKNKSAVSEYEDLEIDSSFRVWIPRNDYEYNQMIQMMCSSDLLSHESGIELNTLSKPDEKARVKKELEEKEQREEDRLDKEAKRKSDSANNDTQKQTIDTQNK